MKLDIYQSLNKGQLNEVILDKEFYGFDGQTYKNSKNANVDPQASMNESEHESIEFDDLDSNAE